MTIFSLSLAFMGKGYSQLCDLTIDIGRDTTVCGESSFTLSYIAPADSIDWVWSDGSTDTTLTVTISGTYSITIFTPSCQLMASIKVKFESFPDVQVISAPVCFGDTTFFNVETEDIIDSLSFIWDFGDGTGSNVGSPLVSHVYAQGPENFTVMVTAINRAGCFETDTLIATVKQQPMVEFLVDDVCLGEPTYFIIQTSNTDSNATMGLYLNRPFQFIPLPINTDTFFFIYQTEGVFRPHLILENENGCLDSVSYDINVFPLPNAGFDGLDLTYCQGDPVDTLYAFMAGGDFEGNGITPLESGSALLSPISAGELIPVSYHIVNEFGCENVSEQVIRSIFARPTIDFLGLTSSYCLSTIPDTIAVSLTGGVFEGPESVLTDPTPFDSFAIFYPMIVGTYEIGYSYVDSNQCLTAIERSVQVFDLPVADLGPDTFIFAGETIILSNAVQLPEYRYLWSNGTTNPMLSIQNPGYYLLEITDANTSCQAIDTIFVDLGNSTDFLEKKGIKIGIYPNPVVDDAIKVFIESKDSLVAEWLDMGVMNSAASILNSKKVYIEPGFEQVIELYVNGYPPGIYYLLLNQQYAIPFIIK